MFGQLKIHFLSDTCFSMPAALDATYDTNVSVDHLGLPTAPGKTLHGLLRDTWLTTRDVLDSQRLGNSLLGSPRSHKDDGLLRIGDARMDVGTLEWIRQARERTSHPIGDTALRDAFLLSRTQTAEDRATGAPKTDTLRVMRVVPAGTILYAPLTLKESRQHRGAVQPLQDLFELLAKLTRHVGLDRNRGLGHVRLEVTWSDKEEDVSWNVPTTLPETETCFIPVLLTLTAPCLIADRALDPNSRATKSFITGSAMRGALAAALIRVGADEGALHTILVSGIVRFLNAYPAEKDAAGTLLRALPPPITWQRKKDVTIDDTDQDAEPRNLLPLLMPQETPEFADQLTGFDSPFFASRRRGEHRPVKVTRRYATHQSRDRILGVASREQSTVFVYEALEADQTFLGVIALPVARPDLHQLLLTALREPLWLGRSLRSGYGGMPQVIPNVKNWNLCSEIGLTPSSIQDGDTFQIRLTSDAVLRDPITGQHDPWQLENVLRQKFENIAAVEKVCVTAGTAQGYNRLWRTELPTLPCAQAGSVALMKAITDISSELIFRKQAEPLGERTAEGKGCFIIESDSLDSEGKLIIRASNKSLLSADTDRQMQEPEPEESRMLVDAQRRLYAIRLRLLLGDIALTVAQNASGLPPPSLIQRLRTPLGMPHLILDQPAPWRKTFTAWLKPGVPSIWRERYDEWMAAVESSIDLSPDESLRMSEKALSALSRCYLKIEEKQITLSEFLWLCARIDRLPLSESFRAEQQKYRITSETTADALWEEETRRLTLFFLDTFLSRLARLAKQRMNSAHGMIGDNANG